MAYSTGKGNLLMADRMINIDSVCAIVVTYNPNIEELKENMESVVHQVGGICIVDNSTDASLQEKLLAFQDNKKFHVLSNKGNYGIAFAQNIGMKWALDKGYEAFFQLDQDSKLMEDTVLKLVNEYNFLLSQDKKIACIGPLAFDRDKSEDDVYHNYNSTNERIIKVPQTLSSGSLIPKDAFIGIGGMEEDLFIDLVDYEWCWRAEKQGYSTYVTNDVKMAHRLGEDRYHFLGKSIGVPSPIRHYYQFRNTLEMLKRSYVPLNFKVKYIPILLFKFFFFSLFVKPRAVRFRMMVKGTMDALRGVKGNINGDRPGIVRIQSHE
ncbi:glycosyltransferase family 2 protein [Neobacillus drentensis]|uniref:glycosyltransferase family 2 protein n=1 Tax=Neobacillus drentensis TaxID=220684 RepID=UPI001F3E321F|nr:glycosyltransferase family 2 protein [Neobacillus drentensis]ULT56455.1 glycosyltransferase family 2 protein [Neobacillus drentensis]